MRDKPSPFSVFGKKRAARRAIRLPRARKRRRALSVRPSESKFFFCTLRGAARLTLSSGQKASPFSVIRRGSHAARAFFVVLCGLLSVILSGAACKAAQPKDLM